MLNRVAGCRSHFSPHSYALWPEELWVRGRSRWRTDWHDMNWYALRQRGLVSWDVRRSSAGLELTDREQEQQIPTVSQTEERDRRRKTGALDIDFPTTQTSTSSVHHGHWSQLYKQLNTGQSFPYKHAASVVKVLLLMYRCVDGSASVFLVKIWNNHIIFILFFIYVLIHYLSIWKFILFVFNTKQFIPCTWCILEVLNKLYAVFSDMWFYWKIFKDYIIVFWDSLQIDSGPTEGLGQRFVFTNAVVRWINSRFI